MTAHQKGGGFIFDSMSGDPGRARPLSDEEFEHLADALEMAVVPLLQTAADALSQKPGIIARVKSCRGWAELEADWSNRAAALL